MSFIHSIELYESPIRNQFQNWLHTNGVSITHELINLSQTSGTFPLTEPNQAIFRLNSRNFIICYPSDRLSLIVSCDSFLVLSVTFDPSSSRERKRMTNHLVVFDIDGVIWNKKSVPYPEIRSILEYFKSENFTIGISSMNNKPDICKGKGVTRW